MVSQDLILFQFQVNDNVSISFSVQYILFSMTIESVGGLKHGTVKG